MKKCVEGERRPIIDLAQIKINGSEEGKNFYGNESSGNKQRWEQRMGPGQKLSDLGSVLRRKRSKKFACLLGALGTLKLKKCSRFMRISGFWNVFQICKIPLQSALKRHAKCSGFFRLGTVRICV
jgi:hypothetical protein